MFDSLTAREKRAVLGYALGVYFVLGWFVFAAVGGDSLGFDYTATEAAGIAVFWPLFAVKYLAIGIWAVLSSGFSTLIGA